MAWTFRNSEKFLKEMNKYNINIYNYWNDENEEDFQTHHYYL